MSIPLGVSNRDDCLIWLWTPPEKYSVKSGYTLVSPAFLPSDEFSFSPI